MSMGPQSWCPCSLEAWRKVKGRSILLSCIFSFSEFPVFSLLGVDFSLKQQFSTTVLPLRGYLQCLGYFWLSQLRQGRLLASKWVEGMAWDEAISYSI